MSDQTPAEFRSTTPERQRCHAQEEADGVKALLRQLLLKPLKTANRVHRLR